MTISLEVCLIHAKIAVRHASNTVFNKAIRNGINQFLRCYAKTSNKYIAEIDQIFALSCCKELARLNDHAEVAWNDRSIAWQNDSRICGSYCKNIMV